MRKITMIVLHCSGVKPNVHQDISILDSCHSQKGWKGIGYHARFPDAVIMGHHDLNPQKPCPCFDAVEEYWDLQPQK